MEGVILKNYTPHEINIFSDYLLVETIAPEENSIRLVESRKSGTGTFLNIPWVFPAKYVSLINLPDDRDCNIIVSALVGQYLKDNMPACFKGVYAPDTGPDGVVRDSSTGRILGVSRLIKYC